MKILYVVLLFVFSCINGFCQRKEIPPEKPKLIIGIVVDQMRYEYLYRYWNKFQKGGFKRLVQEGTLCKNTNLNYIFTQTAVGHASIFTGATPSVHGIVANEWYLSLKKEEVYCVADDKVKPVGTSSKECQMSPKHLMCTTIGDEIKLSQPKGGKVIGVSLKDRASILSAGQSADGAYWFDDATGNWVTSNYYMDTLPNWVKEFNDKKLTELYLNKEWTSYLAADQYVESLPDENLYEVGLERKQHVFPYNLQKISQIKEGTYNYSVLRTTPYGNILTADFAKAAIINEGLGKDTNTDMLIVSFSSTDYIGHNYGPRSMEVEDAFLRLDLELVTLLEFIDDNIGKENVLIFLTSDHGVAEVPQYMTDNKLPGGIFKHNKALVLLKAYLNAIYGEGDWIAKYSEEQLYLNHDLIEDAKVPLAEIQEKCASFLLEFSGVSQVAKGVDLVSGSFSDGVFKMMQNNYFPKRSGDILISLSSGYTEDIAYSTTHNSIYKYDTHVPLIWYGWKINRKVVSRNLSITDIAPTISLLLNISYPSGCNGSPIDELIE